MARVGALIAALGVVLLLLGGESVPGARHSTLAYYWPIKPFDRQHPIRGAFGDPRTLATDELFGDTHPDDGGSYSFHQGIDIAAPPGTPVYPVVSGRVVILRRHAIVVSCGHGRYFQYWHLRDNVTLGEEVTAEQTILGWIRRPFDHVHFGEADLDIQVNPLAPGHLEPYADHTKPVAVALDLGTGRTPKLTDGGTLKPGETVAIEAVDPPAMPVHGPFAGLPQTPALVEWRLRSGNEWGRWHVAADFRHIVPPASDFWHVYAAGAYQNAPVFNRRLYSGIAGRYLFRVDLHTSRLAPGSYELEARVADIRGNHSTTTWPLRVSGP